VHLSRFPCEQYLPPPFIIRDVIILIIFGKMY
jgi:hypothetical protein